ncbi:MAG: GNAT family N-acetyltransferase [Pseudomonadota bacterium]
MDDGASGQSPQPGDRYTVTYLEMTAPPATPVPKPPSNVHLAVIMAEQPPVDWFLYLYRTVGEPYLWTDWLRAPREEVEAFIQDPEVTLHTLMLDGWPGGFFMLDTRAPELCDLSYFGLVPEAVGRGLGQWFLATAIAAGWAREGVEKMTVNTCTLDHPRALGTYQRLGFTAVHREERVLKG